ncbi:hypothetical protein BGZ59_004877 [Podila verticillata]|nr:hypothetical protein BGZ59_004877 [Podila verticillata]KFH65956.1 hypothetical protein MVEG_08058 [Podila verticillata NRRL 6337]
MKPYNLQALYVRPGSNDAMSTYSGSSRDMNGRDKKPSNGMPTGNSPPPHQPRFQPPSIFQEAYLSGILHKPRDILFLFRVVSAVLWSVVRLHCIELPYLIATRFKKSTNQKPAAWNWFTSVAFAIIRTGANQVRTIGQLRFIGHGIVAFFSFLARFERRVKISSMIQFEVHLDVLLGPERASLNEVRETLKEHGSCTETMNPSEEYLESFHPQHSDGPVLANMPDEVGPTGNNGSYVLKGEWIEALQDPEDTRPRSTTVVLYFHGGAYSFCSARSHTKFLAQLVKEIGPGTRAFSVDYRLAPENPFPAAIHDAYAAYLYLTDPDNAALTLSEDSAPHELSVDPRDIVVGGDSAGGNLAAALMQYLVRYVKPAVLPHATLLLSPWTDVTSSVPAAHCEDWFCYCPGPVGTSPTDKSAYLEFKLTNFTSKYLVGDEELMLNARNALGVDRRWEWYTHLSQHPLTSLAHSNPGSLEGLTDTIVQTASHDRLLDDSRLFAHRAGRENPSRVTRIEIYKDMTHVHQLLSFLFTSSRIATRNLARFVERSRYIRDEREREQEAAARVKRGPETYASVLRRVSTRDAKKPEPKVIPAFMTTNMVSERSREDGVEWVLVEQNGKEMAGDVGWPLSVLIRSWPTHVGDGQREE